MPNSSAKFLPFCQPMKLENKLSASKIQSWYKHMIIVINVLDQKGETGKKKGVIFPSNFYIRADDI